MPESSLTEDAEITPDGNVFVASAQAAIGDDAIGIRSRTAEHLNLISSVDLTARVDDIRQAVILYRDGLTGPAGDTVLDLIAVIAASGPTPEPTELAKLSPEHRKLLGLCHAPVTVADAAAGMALPLSAVHVLLCDLIGQHKIAVLPRRAVCPEGGADLDLLKEVLDGLRSL